ncbi:amphiphysin isoform X2 [Paralichthys olivaceus]|uniref:amphiphysin isoform X2 n=1 Tax=Paralichthys olivaceus TaxID=8255 RepID=UPI0037502978
MAEIKTGIFAKNVQKRLNRAQEKVLQKLGKADETKDEQFEQVVINFRRQESEGSRLQREMKSYMSSIKGMQQASINLTQSLHEVYEPDWHGKDDVMTIGKDCDALWEDFHNKLVDSTLLNLDEYLQQFPDLKTRVAKRSRKLIDYDSARHHVETLQTSGMKNDRKMMKAEEELKKSQKVFDELNVGLQDELPTLWDSRVGFYISTYKSVTSLETKFHREISLVCRQLYEVMTKLGEQHSDKMFTIQGAPSDSGPLRLARTPSPPEDESPLESPDCSSNHMLRPVSPGPPRPKSPTQGPPVPPPPKVTPTKEVAEEQIIDLFGGEFLPAPSPSQPNERPGESLLDLDFDAFQPDESVSPIPQTAVPWDMWSGNSQTAQPATDGGFIADWSADFGSVSANGDTSSSAETPGAIAVGPDETQVEAEGGAQDWHQADGWQAGGETATPPQDTEAATATENEVRKWDSQINTNLHTTAVRGDEDETGQADVGGGVSELEERRKSTPGLIFTNEFGEQIEDSTEDRGEKLSGSPDNSGSEYETAEEWGDGGQGGGWASADDELTYDHHLVCDSDNMKRDYLIEDKLIAVHRDLSDPGGAFDSVPSAETKGGGAIDPDHFAETQEGGAFYSDPFGKTQGGAFDSDPFVETQEGGAFDSDPFAETQGGAVFDSDPFAETQGGGVFDSDLFAETQRGGAFDSLPSPETNGGGAINPGHFAETQEGGAFDSDPFAETQGGGVFDSDPFAETQGGGAFDSDPFVETQGGGAFDSGYSIQTQGRGAFDSYPFAETQGRGAFDLSHSIEIQGRGAFDSDPFAETQGGGAFDPEFLDKTKCGNEESGFEFDPFVDKSGGGRVKVTGYGSGWDSDPFANSFPAASSGTEAPASKTTPWQKISDIRGFDSSAARPNSASIFGAAAEGIKGVNFPRNHKEPDHSDMSEDEAANRRFEKLYQELDTEKEEDLSNPSFFADFDKMNNDHALEASEAQVASPLELAEELDKPAAPPAGDVEALSTPPAGEEDTADVSGSPEEEKPAPTVGSPSSDKIKVQEIPEAEEARTPPGEAASSENMPIPSVVIEPASSNEGDDDRDVDIISPTVINDDGQNKSIKHMSPSGATSSHPEDFLYKVETMHDFEAANSDELELRRGDVVLVVPTASVEDQDAGWLTGIKESEWLTLGAAAQKGLFPDNFTQRLE